ncbi:PIN domain-containing protein [Rubrobacter aplysinae]|uniref:PIN domain-containing protein n=1 Tax=Rubrobacter aplysinae TaxID=909625 RepID=UPI00064C022F|nr:PIN domain-containing protein [Rubrobacter aplysinae]
MQDKFPEHYRLSTNEFENLWRNALFVPDTNVLLDLYRYSKKSHDELLMILQRFQDQLWIPHQVAYEFLNNRMGTINEVREKHRKLRETLEETKSSIKEGAEDLHRGAPFESPELLDNMSTSLNALIADIQTRENMLPAISNSPQEDRIWREVEDLARDRLGEPYSEEKLSKIEEEGQRRTEKQVPPGYKDEGHGDLVIWRQMVDKALETSKPIAFITKDVKDDWWWRAYGQTIGVRKELIQEIKEDAGVIFHIYTTDRFIEYAKQYLQAEVSEETISEAEQLSRLSRNTPREREMLDHALRDDSIISKEQRDILKIHLYDGLSLEEIADMLGVSQHQVSKILKRAISNLGKRLPSDSSLSYGEFGRYIDSDKANENEYGELLRINEAMEIAYSDSDISTLAKLHRQALVTGRNDNYDITPELRSEYKRLANEISVRRSLLKHKENYPY